MWSERTRHVNKDYAEAAGRIPAQALAIKVAEMADMDLEHVHGVDIHCEPQDFPVVTITSLVRHSGELIECLSKYQLVPIEDGKEPNGR